MSDLVMVLFLDDHADIERNKADITINCIRVFVFILSPWALIVIEPINKTMKV